MPLFSRLFCVMNHWHCMEKENSGHNMVFKGKIWGTGLKKTHTNTICDFMSRSHNSKAMTLCTFIITHEKTLQSYAACVAMYVMKNVFLLCNFMPWIINNGLDIISTICCDVNLQTRLVQGFESGLQFPLNTLTRMRSCWRSQVILSSSALCAMPVSITTLC